MKKDIVFHPLIITLYPVVALYLRNFYTVAWPDTVPSFALTLLAVVLLWVAVQRVVQSVQKSALMVSVVFLLFFSYGHILRALENYIEKFTGPNPALWATFQGQAALGTLLAIWVLLWGTISFLTIKSKFNFSLVTQFMNMASIALMAIALYQAGTYIWSIRQLRESLTDSSGAKMVFRAELDLSDISPAANRPDIYYIILDGYARSDVMADLYGYDNTPFLDFLRQGGFYIADQSRSNYPVTFESLSSSLNFDYINWVADKVGHTSSNFLPLIDLLRDNRLSRFLHAQGYETALFSSGFMAAEAVQADVRYESERMLNSFENELINQTPLRLWLIDMQYQMHRQRIQYQFAQLPAASSDAASNPKPRFIFAHIIAPHPPFVFQADGGPIRPDWEFIISDGSHFTNLMGHEAYVRAYSEQARYTTSQAQVLIGKLLALNPPPIIIVQSDHGPGAYLDWENRSNTNLTERFSILNAYYFPGQNYAALYPTITPVNSFRVVLNQYFGAHFDLLEDRSYWAPFDFPFDLEDVTDQLTPSK